MWFNQYDFEFRCQNVIQWKLPARPTRPLLRWNQTTNGNIREGGSDNATITGARQSKPQIKETFTNLWEQQRGCVSAWQEYGQGSRFSQNFHLCLRRLLCYHMTQISYSIQRQLSSVSSRSADVSHRFRLYLRCCGSGGVCKCVHYYERTHTHTAFLQELWHNSVYVCFVAPNSAVLRITGPADELRPGRFVPGVRHRRPELDFKWHER